MFHPSLLAERVAVVAGGGRGIGEACSRQLAAAGAQVVVVDKAADRAERVAEDLGDVASPFVVNLRDDDAASAVVGHAVDRFGRIDVLANIAGGMRPDAAWRPMNDWTRDQWDFTFRQNVGWVHDLCRAVIPQMIAQGDGGSIVNIGSASGVWAAPKHGPYGAAKAAVIHLVRTIAIEHGADGIRANVVSPGSIITPATAETLSPEERARQDELIPLGRTGTPDDIAKAVVFLASPLADYISGQQLVVDGAAGVKFPYPVP